MIIDRYTYEMLYIAVVYMACIAIYPITLGMRHQINVWTWLYMNQVYLDGIVEVLQFPIHLIDYVVLLKCRLL